MVAAGHEHPLREPAQRTLRAIARGDLDAVTDSEVFQEIRYRYLHIGEREMGKSMGLTGMVAMVRRLAEQWPRWSVEPVGLPVFPR